MKKIYVFTLKGSNYFSVRFGSDLRLFAYMLYTYLEDFSEYSDTYSGVLNMNDNLVFNDIHENVEKRIYQLDSDIDDSLVDCEPFIVNKNSFALTINDDIMNMDNIKDCVNYIKRLLKNDCEIEIRTFSYEAEDINDESNRYKAIKAIYDELKETMPKKYSFVSRLLHSVTKKKK